MTDDRHYVRIMAQRANYLAGRLAAEPEHRNARWWTDDLRALTWAVETLAPKVGLDVPQIVEDVKARVAKAESVRQRRTREHTVGLLVELPLDLADRLGEAASRVRPVRHPAELARELLGFAVEPMFLNLALGTGTGPPQKPTPSRPDPSLSERTPRDAA